MLNPEQLAEFQANSWGREPRLFRQAIDVSHYPLPEEDLCELTADERVESRLIADDMSLTHGPFENDDARGRLLPDGSILLVQCLEQHFQVARNLLDQEFGFIPGWQVDDVMASLGYNGASCGAHFDKYDVFLVQHTGRKVWQLDKGNHVEDELNPTADIRLLQSFQPTDTWITDPGDVLYVPPGFGHHGVCEQTSITLSVGIRNPTMVELLADLSEFAMFSLEDNPTVNTQLFAHSADITGEPLMQLESALTKVLDRQLLQRWFGSYTTRLREPDLLDVQDANSVSRGMTLSATLPTRLATSENLLFINGDIIEVGTADLEWIKELAQQRRVTLPEITSDSALETLEAHVVSGALSVEGRSTER